MCVHVGGCHMAGKRSRGIQRDRRSGHSPTASPHVLPAARTAGRNRNSATWNDLRRRVSRLSE
ncbi:hypothetical protein OG834_01485 [Streptomyces mirabilis]|nr:hypothetical protein [Streptomyces mirabilis]MCX4429765.1 hypothetical protein [Streptomyces mirabilis]